MPGSSPEDENIPAVAETATPSVETTETDVNTADSSAASEKEGQPETMLDAVKAAISPSDTEKSPDSETDGSKAEAASESEAKAEEEELGDPTEEELSLYKPKTQRRMRQLLEERNAVRAELETVKSRAESFDRINDFVAKNGLSEEDVNVGFGIMAAIANDPRRALEALTPIYQQLQSQVGAVLPQDLAEDVRLGYISEQRAYELAQTRAQANFTSQRAERERETYQREQMQRQQTAHVEAVAGAVTSWERAKSANDPDWNLKQARIGELMELEVRRSGYPQSAKHAVELAETVLKKVETEMKRFAPRTQAVTPVSGGASPRSTQQPQTMLEAIRMAAGG